jgi:hypothetical protein
MYFLSGRDPVGSDFLLRFLERDGLALQTMWCNLPSNRSFS